MNPSDHGVAVNPGTDTPELRFVLLTGDRFVGTFASIEDGLRALKDAQTVHDRERAMGLGDGAAHTHAD